MVNLVAVINNSIVATYVNGYTYLRDFVGEGILEKVCWCVKPTNANYLALGGVKYDPNTDTRYGYVATISFDLQTIYKEYTFTQYDVSNFVGLDINYSRIATSMGDYVMGIAFDTDKYRTNVAIGKIIRGCVLGVEDDGVVSGLFKTTLYELVLASGDFMSDWSDKVPTGESVVNIALDLEKGFVVFTDAGRVRIITGTGEVSADFTPIDRIDVAQVLDTEKVAIIGKYGDYYYALNYVDGTVTKLIECSFDDMLVGLGGTKYFAIVYNKISSIGTLDYRVIRYDTLEEVESKRLNYGLNAYLPINFVQMWI